MPVTDGNQLTATRPSTVLRPATEPVYAASVEGTVLSTPLAGTILGTPATALYSSVSMEVLEDQMCVQRCTEMCTNAQCASSCRTEFCSPAESPSFVYTVVGVFCVIGLLIVAYSVFFGRRAKPSRRKYHPRPQDGSYLSL